MVTWFDYVYDDGLTFGIDDNGWLLATWPHICLQCHRPTYYVEINFGCFLHRACEDKFLEPLLCMAGQLHG